MWDGRTLPNYPDGQPKLKILRIQVPSGVTLPWHYHPVINAAFADQPHDLRALQLAALQCVGLADGCVQADGGSG